MRHLLAAMLILVAAPAAADPAADVTRTMQAFFDGIAAHKADTAGVEVLIAPWGWTVGPDAAAFDLLHDQLVKPKLSKVVATASATSAWFSADVTAQLPAVDGPTVAGHLRASAVLEKTSTGWHVRVVQLSRAAPNGTGQVERCTPNMPADIAPGAASAPAQTVIDALDAGKVASVMSTDKHALMIGSAPNERYTGPAIAKLFGKLALERSPRDGARAAFRAGTAGDLVWIVVPTWTSKYCVEYLTLFVLHQEGNAWKIVHQHYAEVSYAGVL